MQRVLASADGADGGDAPRRRWSTSCLSSETAGWDLLLGTSGPGESQGGSQAGVASVQGRSGGTRELRPLSPHAGGRHPGRRDTCGHLSRCHVSLDSAGPTLSGAVSPCLGFMPAPSRSPSFPWTRCASRVERSRGVPTRAPSRPVRPSLHLSHRASHFFAKSWPGSLPPALGTSST